MPSCRPPRVLTRTHQKTGFFCVIYLHYPAHWPAQALEEAEQRLRAYRGVPHTCSACSGRKPKTRRPKQLATLNSVRSGSWPSGGPFKDSTS